MSGSVKMLWKLGAVDCVLFPVPDLWPNAPDRRGCWFYKSLEFGLNNYEGNALLLERFSRRGIWLLCIIPCPFSAKLDVIPPGWVDFEPP